MAGPASTTITPRVRALQQTGQAVPLVSGHKEMVHHGQCRAHRATCILLVGRAVAVAEADRPVPEATDHLEADLARDAHTQEIADLEAPTAGTACRTDHPRDMVVLEARWAVLTEDQSLGSSLLEPHHDKMDILINSITLAAQVVPEAPEAQVVISQKGWDLSPAKVDHQDQEESRPEGPLPDMDPDLDMDPDPGLKVLEADPGQVPAPTELALLLRDLLLSTAQVLHQALAQARLLLQPRPSQQASQDRQRLKIWEFRRVNKTVIVLSCRGRSIYMS